MEIHLHLYDKTKALLTSEPIKTELAVLPRKGEVLFGIDSFEGKQFEVSEVGYWVSTTGFTGLVYVNADEQV